MQQLFFVFVFILGHNFSNIVDISEHHALDSEQELFDNSDDIEEEENTSCLDIFFKEIETKICINSLTVGDRLSAYYVPEFKTSLMRICKKFPIWTNIMVPFFKSPYTIASSASVEGEFSQLKNSILKHESRLLPADRFVVTHLRSIENDMKIVRSEQVYSTKKLLVDDSLENITTDDLNTNDVISSNDNFTSSSSTTSISDDDTFNAEECWRGLNNIKTGPLINSREKTIQMPSTPKKRRTKYLES